MKRERASNHRGYVHNRYGALQERKLSFIFFYNQKVFRCMLQSQREIRMHVLRFDRAIILMLFLLVLTSYAVDARNNITADQALMKISQNEPIYDALIIGDLDLSRIPGGIIDRPIIIRRSTIQGSIIFQFVTFNKDVDLSNSIIIKNVNFMHAKFLSDAVFRGTQFNGSRFHSLFSDSFLFVTFNNSADFSGSTFNGTAEFGQTTFNGIAKFRGAEFKGLSDFSYVNFYEDADFTHANFNDAQFDYAHFFGDAAFLGSHFSNADFVYTQFDGNANLYAWFDQKLNLDFAKLTNFEILWNSIKNGLQCDDSVYLTLIKNFKDKGWFEDSEDCYYKYRQWKLAEEPWSSGTKYLDILAWITCGYGVRWLNTIMSALLVLTIFAFYFSLKDGFVKMHNHGVLPDLEKSFYFSIIIILSAPTDWYVNIFSNELYVAYVKNNKYSIILERILGWGILLLLVNTLLRLMIRY